MGTSNLISKEQLCKIALRKMMLEAKKEATAQFKTFPNKVRIELEFTNDNNETSLLRMLSLENIKYDQILNIKNTKSAKAHLLEEFNNNKELYDNDLNFNEFGYEGQLRRIVEQLLMLKKIEYLKDILSNVESTNAIHPKEKIEWLGTPSEFGLLFNELEKAGYIKKSSHRRTRYKDAWAHTSDLLFDAFSISNLSHNGETSPENLRKEVSKPTISYKDHGFFKITRPNHK